MAKGDLRVRGTAVGFLAAGWSSQHLWWSSHDDNGQPVRSKKRTRRDERLISGGDICAALRCRSCGTIAFQPSEVDDDWGTDGD